MLRVLACLALVLACLSDSRAEPMIDGNELHENGKHYVGCKRKETRRNYDPSRSAHYMGYLEACYDSSLTLQLTIPAGTKLGAFCEIVYLYLENHPEKRHLPGNEVVEAAVLAAYSPLPAQD